MSANPFNAPTRRLIVTHHCRECAAFPPGLHGEWWCSVKGADVTAGKAVCLCRAAQQIEEGTA